MWEVARLVIKFTVSELFVALSGSVADRALVNTDWCMIYVDKGHLRGLMGLNVVFSPMCVGLGNLTQCSGSID